VRGSRRHSGDDVAADDLKAFGAPGTIISAVEHTGGNDGRFGIYQSGVDAFNLFMSCTTQWRTAGQSAVVIGLDYSGVDVVMRNLRIRRNPVLWTRFQAMESAALSEMNK